MKKNIFLLISMFWISPYAYAQDHIFSEVFIKSICDKVNKYQLAHPWKETDDNWIRGTYYTGVIAFYQATGDKNYLQQCNNWGEKLGWHIPKLKPDGPRGAGVNQLTCGQTWMESYMAQKKKYKIEPIVAYLDDPSNRNAISKPLAWYVDYDLDLRYVDGLFTGPPALAMLYKITRKEKYLNWMDACFWDIYGALYDRNEGLFYRDIRFKPGYSGEITGNWLRPDSILYNEARRSYVYQKTKNGKKVLWSRGNGWALAGLARVLKYLPPDHANYVKYKAVFIRMADELKKRQQPDGFWYPNLADPEDYGTPETSGTGFFTYGLAWGVNNGILPREKYLPVVKKAWAALVSAVSDEGKVQWGQMVGASPYKILQEDSHEYVSGMFLLASSEMYKLEK